MAEQFAGVCPKCGSENLKYDTLDVSNSSLSYPMTCLDCSFRGNECYEKIFIGFLDDKGNDIEN